VPRRVPRDALGAFTAVAHAQEFEADQLDVELGFVLLRDVAAPPKLLDGEVLAVRALPAAERMATCVRVGLPEQAHLITGRIGRFVEANGYRLAGPGREVFVQPPPLERMHESVVEMQFPVEKAERRRLTAQRS
jgi:effector-binding domain-containing protein